MIKFDNGKANKLLINFGLLYIGIITGSILLVGDYKSWVALIWSVGAVLMACCLYKMVIIIKEWRIKKNGVH